MDKQEKVRRMEKVAENLEELEGVEEAILDDYAPETANSGQIAVVMKGSESFNVYKLVADLRSFAHRMRYILEEADLLTYNVFEKPERVYNVVNDPIGHDKSMYMVEVVP